MLVNGLNDNEGWVSPIICRLSDRKSWFMSTEISLPDQANSNQKPISNTGSVNQVSLISVTKRQ